MKTPRTAGWLVCSLALALPACSDSSRPTASPAPTTSAQAAPTEVVNPHPAPAAKTGDEARALVDQWAAAQNEGKPEAYAALYAPKFEGVRRSGSRVWHLDRARWLKLREEAIQKKAEVKVSDVSVIPSLAGAVVTFTQQGAQGPTSDEGQKRLVLVRSEGKLLIAREELLRADKGKEAGTPGAAGQVTLAIRTPKPMLVLDTNPKDEWGDETPWLATRGDVVQAGRTVDASKLPPELASVRGKRFELFGKAGKVCEATVTSFGLLGQVKPNASFVTRWDGKDEASGEALGDVDVAKDAWDLSATRGEAGGRVLTGLLFASQGKCDEALWGRPLPEAPKGGEAEAGKEAAATDAKAAGDKAKAAGDKAKSAGDKAKAGEEAPKAETVVVEAKPADNTTRDKVLQDLRKLPAYAELQKEYEGLKAAGDPARWEEAQGSKQEVLVMELPSGVTLITATLSAGTGCGTFGGALSAVWESKGGKLTRVSEAFGEALPAVSAADVDGDGRFEIVFENGMLRSSGAHYEQWERLVVPALDSGC
ncbi:nuclear transport factor 2 family protein [Chondromyces crocatus]|uniref:DUF4440 domain-containing protein n=1 Tax=Chondromyces crocatus TaxID=52 RepID=A0A0K1EFN1_CHOCO|nr:nuclear transport factor 2 family protein [Chondromyces crocatus]AKT39502.1 uncharacterized protein CMC5_036490 [Chondromyces crocatus]